MSEKRYFTPINGDGKSFGVWTFDGKLALRVGVPNPLGHASSHVEIAEGQDLPQAMLAKLKSVFSQGEPCILKDMALKPGEYYHRMARPSEQHPSDSPGSCPEPKNYEHEIAVARGQLVSLVSRLQQICQNVHPSPETFSTYGHEIRNLLILACTEVEAQWKGILEANGRRKNRYTTNDYVILNRAMLLDQYVISLPHYPWLPVFRPFKGWGSTGKPTTELSWYSAYNSVKHDREHNFSEAKLVHAIDAVCACMAMLCAQYGKQQATRWRHEIAYFFQLDAAPAWCPSETYVHPYEGYASGYKAVSYPFP